MKINPKRSSSSLRENLENTDFFALPLLFFLTLIDPILFVITTGKRSKPARKKYIGLPSRLRIRLVALTIFREL
ncbi:MAG: hypothetical protein ACD_13C00107G0017 [uncultured bacterium]|nr:MAG: hypothetical protein ACD_13C00107G0017 [uncultured bacterium]